MGLFKRKHLHSKKKRTILAWRLRQCDDHCLLSVCCEQWLYRAAVDDSPCELGSYAMLYWRGWPGWQVANTEAIRLI